MNKTQFAFAAFLSTVAAQSLSAVDVKVVNDSSASINVFVRGTGTEEFLMETIPQKTTQAISIAANKFDNRPTFELITVKDEIRVPDWKVLEGTCANLDATRNHTVLVENGTLGLATSCKVVE